MWNGHDYGTPPPAHAEAHSAAPRTPARTLPDTSAETKAQYDEASRQLISAHEQKIRALKAELNKLEATNSDLQRQNDELKARPERKETVRIVNEAEPKYYNMQVLFNDLSLPFFNCKLDQLPPNPDPLEAKPGDKQEEHPIYAPSRLEEEFKQALLRVWRDHVGKKNGPRPFVEVRDFIKYYTPWLRHNCLAMVLGPRRLFVIQPTWHQDLTCCDVFGGECQGKLGCKGPAAVKPLFYQDQVDWFMTTTLMCPVKGCTKTVVTDDPKVVRHFDTHDLPFVARQNYGMSVGMEERHLMQAFGGASSMEGARTGTRHAYAAVVSERLTQFTADMRAALLARRRNPDPTGQPRIDAGFDEDKQRYREKVREVHQLLDGWADAGGHSFLPPVDVAELASTKTYWGFLCPTSYRAALQSQAQQLAPLQDLLSLERARGSESGSIDFTFNSMDKTKGNADKPTSMCTVNVQKGFTAGFAACPRESMTTVQELLRVIKLHSEDDAGKTSFKYFWTDNCCNTGNKIRAIFPDVQVKQDIMHIVGRIPPCLKKDISLRKQFIHAFRQAIWAARGADNKAKLAKLGWQRLEVGARRAVHRQADRSLHKSHQALARYKVQQPHVARTLEAFLHQRDGARGEGVLLGPHRPRHARARRAHASVPRLPRALLPRHQQQRTVAPRSQPRHQRHRGECEPCNHRRHLAHRHFLAQQRALTAVRRETVPLHRH